jgi:hypothetical protein
MYIAIHECVILVILHIFKMSYQLRNIEQCYLPGKMADNMHSHGKSDHHQFTIFICVLFILPTAHPVSSINMNYFVDAVGGIIGTTRVAWGRFRFLGPVKTV